MVRDLIYAAQDMISAKISGDILRGGIKVCDEILMIPDKIKQREEFKKKNARILNAIEEEQKYA